MNLDNLQNKLTKAFITYQYRLENPFPAHTETPAIQHARYTTDPLFHNRVDSLVAGIMRIVIEEGVEK